VLVSLLIAVAVLGTAVVGITYIAGRRGRIAGGLRWVFLALGLIGAVSIFSDLFLVT